MRQFWARSRKSSPCGSAYYCTPHKQGRRLTQSGNDNGSTTTGSAISFARPAIWALPAIWACVPPSTAAGWIRGESKDVVTHEVLELREVELQAEVLKPRRSLRVMRTVVGLLVFLVRVTGGLATVERTPHIGRRCST